MSLLYIQYHGTVYIYIHCVVVNTRTQKVSWSLCVGGVTGTVFFFLNFFLRGTFGKGDRADDFFSYYILIQYIYYTAGYFRLQISMHLLFVYSREGAKKVTLDDRCQTKKNAIFYFCVCVLCAAATKLFQRLVTHNTRPYNRLFCDSSFVHLFNGLTQSRLFFFPYGPYGPLNELPWCVSFSLIFWLYMPATVIFSVCVSSVFHYIT